MIALLIETAVALAPFLLLLAIVYLRGRCDGHLAEKHRRAHLADSLLAKKNREGVIRL